MDDVDVSNSNHEVDSTWNQMQRHVKKDGFREGAGKGQEYGTTRGFNDGYADGFRLGNAVGQQLGKLQLQRLFGTSNHQELLTSLDKIEDHCEICLSANSTMDHLTYSQIKALQFSRTDQLERNLMPPG